MSTQQRHTAPELRPVSAAETYPLRIAVLRGGRPTPPISKPGDEDPGAFHLGAFLGREMVGTASFIPLGLEGYAAALADELRPQADLTYKLRGMAVLEQHQRCGIGAALVAHGLELLRERNAALIWCHARCTAQGFYERQGLQVFGEVFDRRGPHVVMWRWVDDEARP